MQESLKNQGSSALPITGGGVDGTSTNDTVEKRSAPLKNLDFLCRSDVSSWKQTIKVNEQFNLKIKESVNVVLELFHMFGLDKPSTRPEDSTYSYKYKKSVLKTVSRIQQHHIDTGSNEGSWIKYWKYKSNAFFAAWEGQALPACPFKFPDHPKYLFGGVIGQWCRTQCQRDLDLLAAPLKGQLFSKGAFVLSVLMMKKGMPRADENLCRQAEIETVKALTSKREQRKPRWSSKFFDKDWVDERWLYIMGPSPAGKGRLWRYHSRDVKGISKRDVFNLLRTDNWEPATDLFIHCAPKPKLNLYDRIRKNQAKEQLRRTMREMFGGKRFGPTEMSEPQFPSTSANYNKSRGKGGAAGHFKDEMEKMVKNLYQHDLQQSFETQNYRFSNRQTELYGKAGLEEQIDSSESVEKLCYEFDPTIVTETYRNFYWRMFKDALDEEPVVNAVALPEALKIRVISKGPPKTYFVLKTFQKFMWRTLKSHPTFRLIGKPIAVEDIEEICPTSGDYWFNSGDYVASTDNLYSWVSETLLDEMSHCMEIPHQLITLTKRALTGHIFEDESLEGGRAEQKTGQLMGSIVSFPFLCLANAAMCRWALEISEKRTISLRDSRILINGDDNLIATTSSQFFDVWELCCSLIGLDSSPGKTYFNQKFAVINSAHYDLCEGSWRERGYINMGLVKGLKRSIANVGKSKENEKKPRPNAKPVSALAERNMQQDRENRAQLKKSENQRSLMDIAAAFNALKRTTPRDLWDGVSKRFFYYNSKDLKEFKGSWWLPRYAGGLGMECIEEITYHDRQVLAIIQREISQGFKPKAWPMSKDWDTWELASKILERHCPLLNEQSYQTVSRSAEIMPIPYANASTSDLDEENAKVTKLVVLSAFFNEPLNKLYPKKDRNAMRREQAVARDNAKYYQEATKKVKSDTRAVSEEDVYSSDIIRFLNIKLRPEQQHYTEQYSLDGRDGRHTAFAFAHELGFKSLFSMRTTA